MFELALGIVIGLALGWLFIPQPEWLKNFLATDKVD